MAMGTSNHEQSRPLHPLRRSMRHHRLLHAGLGHAQNPRVPPPVPAREPEPVQPPLRDPDSDEPPLREPPGQPGPEKREPDPADPDSPPGPVRAAGSGTVLA